MTSSSTSTRDLDRLAETERTLRLRYEELGHRISLLLDDLEPVPWESSPVLRATLLGLAGDAEAVLREIESVRREIVAAPA